MKYLNLLIVIALLCGAAAHGFAAPPDRIHGELENGESSVVKGNVHPLVPTAEEQGEVAGSLSLSNISIHFTMTESQVSDLARLLEQQQDPSSPQFHKWLSPEEYADRFGLSKSDLKKVTRWLQNAGFTDIKAARGRDYVTMSGTAAHVQYAFQTPLHQYAVRGELHYANANDPVLPKALEGIVGSVRGLNDIHPRPRSVKSNALAGPRPRLTSNLSGNTFVAPGDFATIYDVQALYNNGIDGTGQTIVIPGQSEIQTSLVQAFQMAAGLTAKAPTLVQVGANPGFRLTSGDESESELDVEWAGAVARGATIKFVYSNDVFTSAIYAIDNNLASVLSLTYGSCEAQTSSSSVAAIEAEFRKANAEGMTVVAASGDAGAADCDSSGDPKKPTLIATHGLAVDYPASSAYVTGLGGTEFNEGGGAYWSNSNNSNGGSAVSYIPEIAWNDTDSTNGLSATGGGASALFKKPAWQTGTGVPNDGQRDVPDLALDASPARDPYLYCTAEPTTGANATVPDCTNGFRNVNTYFDPIGGTSVAAPTFAGIVALINQFTNSRQGNINPRLYSLVSIASNPVVHDITLGNNQVACQIQASDVGCTSTISGATTSTMGYVASVGYDQTTGLGSPDVYNLVQQWAPAFNLTASPSSLTLTAGASGTSTVTVAPVGVFTGNVTFTCSVPGTLPNTTCSIPGTVSGSGSATLTVANKATSSLMRAPFQGFPHPGSTIWPVSMGMILIGIPLFFFLTAGRKRTVQACIVMGSLAVIASCGGSGSPVTSAITPAPTITALVTVTATSTATSLTGPLTRTATVSVTVP